MRKMCKSTITHLRHFLAPQKKTKGKGVGEKWEGKFGSLDFRTFDL